MKYIKPNLDREWMEALRYREFEKMGKEGWIKVAKESYHITDYETIEDVLTNIDLDYDSLDEDKRMRFEEAFKKGEVEIPMVVKFADNDYDLLGGNTRLAGLLKNGINPKLWVVDLTKQKSELKEKWSEKYKKSIDCNNPKGFSQKAHCQGRKKKVEETEKLKGGLADSKSLEDIAKKHKVSVEKLTKEYLQGVKVEMEHTNDKAKAKEIAMDHLWEDPTYYTKLKTIEEDQAPAKKQFSIDLQQDPDYKEFKKRAKFMDGSRELTFGTPNVVNNDPYINKRKYSRPGKEEETVESTDASSSGAFTGQAFGQVIKKKHITKIHNMTEQEQEIDEVTDASSSGAYDVPLFGGTKGRKNPLSIGGPDTMYKGRAVKDKNFPKWGGPGGKFVKIKDKCKKFPYCNQGDINALELMETQEVKEAIQETAKKYGLPINHVEKLVLNQFKQIFI